MVRQGPQGAGAIQDEATTMNKLERILFFPWHLPHTFGNSAKQGSCTPNPGTTGSKHHQKRLGNPQKKETILNSIELLIHYCPHCLHHHHCCYASRHLAHIFLSFFLSDMYLYNHMTSTHMTAYLYNRAILLGTPLFPPFVCFPLFSSYGSL